jgi:hypothetical protein
LSIHNELAVLVSPRYLVSTKNQLDELERDFVGDGTGHQVLDVLDVWVVTVPGAPSYEEILVST